MRLWLAITASIIECSGGQLIHVSRSLSPSLPLLRGDFERSKDFCLDSGGEEATDGGDAGSAPSLEASFSPSSGL
jgi:hypothetical protein